MPITAEATTRLWIKDASAGRARHVDLQLLTGEIVGIAGVSGNGQTDLADVVTGMLPLDDGAVLLDGQWLRSPGSRALPSAQVGYIPEQPLLNAVAPTLSVAVNLALRRIAKLPFLPDFSAMTCDARALIEQFDVRPTDPQTLASKLSGGNLQKLVAARELSDEPAVVVACYPTMGLDITASATVYGALFGLARRGCAVLWVSEDLEDLMRYAHRIAVMLDGRVVKVLSASSTSLTEIGAWMTGSAPAQVGPASPAATSPPELEVAR
jgi:simple sugar transport system ATP-binding protein